MSFWLQIYLLVCNNLYFIVLGLFISLSLVSYGLKLYYRPRYSAGASRDQNNESDEGLNLQKFCFELSHILNS